MIKRAGQPCSAVSWLSSLALHLAALNLFVFLVMPRGSSHCPLIVELSPHIASEQEPEVLVALPLEPAIEPDSPDILLPIPEMERSFEVADLVARSDPAQINEALGAPVKHGGANYFGISAQGNRFLYALDMSTSMAARSRHSNDGSRFERAAAELLRSVNALEREQSFGVMLFCFRTRYMFDNFKELPELVPATEKNKRRLRKWLETIHLGAGTDPRLAIDRGLRMEPDAIFMLSDGEFNGHLNQRRITGFVGNPSVQDIILSWKGDKIPIHTIAYEDQINRVTMEEIAQLTGGSFRFVSSGFREGGSLAARASKLLNSAKRIQRRGQTEVALQRYEYIIQQYAGTPAAKTANDLLSQLKQTQL